MTPANEEWRNNPTRRQNAANLHHQWITAVTAAEQHLHAALGALSIVPTSERSGLGRQLQRLLADVRTAISTAESINRDPANDTLIGNMAAFGEGMPPGGDQ